MITNDFENWFYAYRLNILKLKFNHLQWINFVLFIEKTEKILFKFDELMDKNIFFD